jgi:Recombination endonuclease VII
MAAPSIVPVVLAAKRIIAKARAAGLTIDDGNVVDLLADNLPRASLNDLRRALELIGGFPRAVRPDRIDRIVHKLWYMRTAHGEHRVKYDYNITRAEIAAKIRAQNGMCDDCGTDLDKEKTWCQDHDHDTGAVRGVLCPSCNSAIRPIDEMRKHIAYLRKWGADL